MRPAKTTFVNASVVVVVYSATRNAMVIASRMLGPCTTADGTHQRRHNASVQARHRAETREQAVVDRERESGKSTQAAIRPPQRSLRKSADV